MNKLTFVSIIYLFTSKRVGDDNLTLSWLPKDVLGRFLLLFDTGA